MKRWTIYPNWPLCWCHRWSLSIRRIRARLGAPKAIIATAHKLARIFYTLWKTHKQYVDLGARHYEERYKDRIVRSMKKRLHDLGYAVTIEPMAAAEL